MDRLRSLVLLAVLVGPPAAARADEPVGFALDATTGGGFYTGDLGAGAARGAPHVRIGIGAGKGPWAGLISLELPTIFGLEEAQSAAQPAPPEVGFVGVGVGPSVRRELTTGTGLRVHVRLGYTWRWLYGDVEVRRTCDVHGGCAGGYWTENPSYTANGPTLALGLSYRLGRARWSAYGAELAIGRMHVDRRGHDPDLDGTFVTIGVNMALGR